MDYLKAGDLIIVRQQSVVLEEEDSGIIEQTKTADGQIRINLHNEFLVRGLLRHRHETLKNAHVVQFIFKPRQERQLQPPDSRLFLKQLEFHHQSVVRHITGGRNELHLVSFL